jgi:hypothetical protein
MLLFIAISLTCWVCTLIATPHKPRLGLEVEELVYARLLGGQERLVLLAILVTTAGLLAWLITMRPGDMDPDVNLLPQPSIPCALATAAPTSCMTAQPNTLLVREIQDYGQSEVVTTIAAPSPSGRRPTRP